MAHTEAALSLLHPDAPKWNKDFLAAIQTTLKRDPAADLLSMFTNEYREQHRRAQLSGLSAVGKINLSTLYNLDLDFRSDPDLNLLSAFPRTYRRRIGYSGGPKIKSPEADRPVTPDDYRTKLNDAQTATVVYPLSEGVLSLLSLYTSRAGSDTEDHSLADAVKALLWKSTKLWEFSPRGIVVKCDDEIVAKVIMGNREFTEYTSMAYLEQKAPDIPAPRPHGLIALGAFRVTFMSYIPGMTLTKAWPSLCHNQKLSIRQQLDSIFSRLRTLRIDHGHTLGGVCGEGAKEMRIDECATFKDITTTAQYSDLQFSAKTYGSKTYAKFLHSLVNHDGSSSLGEPVFAHGDVRTDNIMVDFRPGVDRIIVNAIIDWEDSGFYPDYHESTTLTRTMSVVDENDWYLYLPDCISPARYPLRWLVDRLWGIHLRTT
nr:hypothetical protein CFP56_73141 [Quercus suber]